MKNPIIFKMLSWPPFSSCLKFSILILIVDQWKNGEDSIWINLKLKNFNLTLGLVSYHISPPHIPLSQKSNPFLPKHWGAIFEEDGRASFPLSVRARTGRAFRDGVTACVETSSDEMSRKRNLASWKVGGSTQTQKGLIFKKTDHSFNNEQQFFIGFKNAH